MSEARVAALDGLLERVRQRRAEPPVRLDLSYLLGTEAAGGQAPAFEAPAPAVEDAIELEEDIEVSEEEVEVSTDSAPSFEEPAYQEPLTEEAPEPEPRPATPLSAVAAGSSAAETRRKIDVKATSPGLAAPPMPPDDSETVRAQDPEPPQRAPAPTAPVAAPEAAPAAAKPAVVVTPERPSEAVVGEFIGGVEGLKGKTFGDLLDETLALSLDS